MSINNILVKVLCLILSLMIFMSCAEKKPIEYVWGNLKNVGPNINSEATDEHITFMPDGNTAVFASKRGGGMGKYDLYTTKRENGKWAKAQLIPAPINTEKDDFDPTISPDGKWLFFASNRSNSDKYWDCDIFVSEWDGEKWGKPEVFDSIFVTPGKPDWGATMPEDFQIFYFASGREPTKKGMSQMFQSRWLEDGWSEPEYMPEPVNSGEWEATPYVTRDGKYLYLNSGRNIKKRGDVDIWKFELVNGKWTNAQLMDGPFQSEKYDYDPSISPDGKKFYFTSNREGTLGESDIWVVEKVIKK